MEGLPPCMGRLRGPGLLDWVCDQVGIGPRAAQARGPGPWSMEEGNPAILTPAPSSLKPCPNTLHVIIILGVVQMCDKKSAPPGQPKIRLSNADAWKWLIWLLQVICFLVKKKWFLSSSQTWDFDEISPPGQPSRKDESPPPGQFLNFTLRVLFMI